MKKEQWIAYMLLGVCFVMLVASAFPHHHHAGGICMLNDVPAFCSACNGNDRCCDEASRACCATGHCTHHASDCTCPACEGTSPACDCGCHHSRPMGCADDCVTKFICSAPAPVQHLSPDFTLITLFYFAADLLTQERLFETSDAYTPYVESLHGIDLVTNGGLRAPPCA